MKVLLLIDCQNDFITGSLANPEAQKAVPNIAKLVENTDAKLIIATKDTHGSRYLETFEGKKLPIKHCISGTQGWKIDPIIKNAMKKSGKLYGTTEKTSFCGAKQIYADIRYAFDNWMAFSGEEIEEFEVCGFCTDICVVSNVLALKEYYPEVKFTIYSNLCAGLTPEKHRAALSVLESCQCEVKEYEV